MRVRATQGSQVTLADPDPSIVIDSKKLTDHASACFQALPLLVSGGITSNCAPKTAASTQGCVWQVFNADLLRWITATFV